MEYSGLENFQAQFNGFYHTPHLFLQDLQGLQPLRIPKRELPVFRGKGLEKIRLGQRVERFVTTELLLDNSISLLAENLQIRTAQKHTIGELDVLYMDGNQPVHLEIQFKYYLYDTAVGTSEIDHCVGPMRRDTLCKKLTKLKEKQLPLLFAKETEKYLEELGVDAMNFIQKIYFKAQLFIPFGEKVTFEVLNPACVYGYYISYRAFEQLETAHFYMPRKVDWLLDVSPDVLWLSYDKILPVLQKFQEEQYASMLWVRQKNNNIIKCFVIA